MAQGYTGYTILDNNFTIKDSPNLDAFSRLRVSNPYPLFSSQFTYDLQPLLFEQIKSPGATIVRSTVDTRAQLTLPSTRSYGDECIMQSFEYFPYQPGKSQLVFISFNFVQADPEVIKYVGLCDGNNGFEFRYTNSPSIGNSIEFRIYSNGGPTEFAAQNSWNLDKLDGTGPSGYTLNLLCTQLLVIDFQALYVGRVRMGFDIGGSIVYCHEFNHSNYGSIYFPYISTANLPIKVGMFCLDAGTTATMDFICSAVISEGGVEDANLFGYNFTAPAENIAVSNGAWTHVLSIRPRLQFNGITNRTKLILTDLDLYNSGTGDIKWQLCVGQNLSASPIFTRVNNATGTEYSATEYYAGTTTLGISPDLIVLDSGFLPKTNGGKGQPISAGAFSRYPITLDASGAQRDLGKLTLRAWGIGGSSNLYTTMKFKEIR